MVELGTARRRRRLDSPMRQEIFLPETTFSFGYGVRTPPVCIYICAHVKDPVVHVRIRWIMETLKHPACTVGWVAQLCCSWLTLGKAARISHGCNPKVDLVHRTQNAANVCVCVCFNIHSIIHAFIIHSLQDVLLLLSLFCFFNNYIVPMGFLPWEIRVAFPGERQLRQSRATQPTVHAGCFLVFP